MKDTKQKWTILLPKGVKTSRNSTRRLTPMSSTRYQEALSRQKFAKMFFEFP
jgi:hypothetical protein